MLYKNTCLSNGFFYTKGGRNLLQRHFSNESMIANIKGLLQLNNFSKSNFHSTTTYANNNYNSNKAKNECFIKQQKFFVGDVNMKLKKKFYKKTDIAALEIKDAAHFLTVNEFDIKKAEDEVISTDIALKENVNNYLSCNENYENLTREELQYEIFKLKIQNLDANTQKNLLKNFSKLKTLFAGSLFHRKYYGVLLDNRKCKSMHLDELKIPTKKLALALAEEWQSQGDMINLYKMHLVSFKKCFKLFFLIKTNHK